MAPAITPNTAQGSVVEFDAREADWIARFLGDIPSALALFDRDLRYVAANSAWINAFGLIAEAVVGRRHPEIDPHGGAVLVELQRRALTGQPAEGSEAGAEEDVAILRRRVLSARPHRDPSGEIVGVVASLQEIPRMAAEWALQDSSDGLTGLAGRHRFMATIRSVLVPDVGVPRATAMFLLDLDNFKGVNDLYGARVGDAVLKAVANRLLAGTRSPVAASGRPSPRGGAADMIARLGADEFGIILGSPSPTLADAEGFARRLLQLVLDPIIIDDQRIRLTANIGYLVTGPHQASEDEVLRDLDIALQEAKTRGPNNAQAWKAALTSTVGRRLVLLDQLRRALDEGEFVMHYQPILRLSDNRIVGAEALLRWNHPSEGLVAPAAFLPVLEESGLIVPVGAWVIREVVRQMRIWQMLYGRDIVDWVSLNVSPRQFNDPDLLLATLHEVNESGFPLERLKIEITESAVMRNLEITRSVLSELHALGIRVAIDDFGTGYSALGALRHYTVDTIKIDRGFTSRIDTADGGELVQALLRIAHVYGAEVIAEGIETTAQCEALRQNNCGFGQGYLFAKPMDGSFFGAYALTHLVQADKAG